MRLTYLATTTLLLLAALIGCMSYQPSIHPTPKKNILLIITDDLNMNIRAYGNEHIVTTNIDKLASQGIKFNRAYVQQSVCSASRASFLSGMRPDSTGVDYPYSHYFVNNLSKKVPLLSSYFKQNGYYTRHLGKIHHGPDIENLSASHFSAPQPNWGLESNQKLLGKKGGHKNLPPYESAPVEDDFYEDGKVAEAAVREIKQLTDNKTPFFLAVGFKKPHLPFRAPSKYWDLYDANQLELAKNRTLPVDSPDYATAHYALKSWNYESSTPTKNISLSAERKLRHAYFAAISYMDAQVGKVMKELKIQGLADNTIVVFISDHGYHLGEQGAWGKTTNFENATQVPLIISAPDMIKANSESNALIEYVDLYPTLVDLAGLKLPEHLEGTSFKPLLESPKRPWKTAAFSQFPRGVLSDLEGYTIRTNRYRYVEWYDKKQKQITARELYDHDIDPSESINIALNSENSTLINNLSNQLKMGWKAALPPGIKNHSNNPIAPPAYAWGKEGKKRREVYLRRYGQKPADANE
ncbi:sulfatase [Paraglaciecola arctica]|uniref:sulfatase n=1 Tax=Paraglaciecola arctica TaxID=1128911 RepID=UPI001C07A678|nr:sulfatase [Paraglaciecola arctica]MBU3005373.1 sulfatase [Paraglaciecola arctica]